MRFLLFILDAKESMSILYLLLTKCKLNRNYLSKDFYFFFFFYYSFSKIMIGIDRRGGGERPKVSNVDSLKRYVCLQLFIMHDNLLFLIVSKFSLNLTNLRTHIELDPDSTSCIFSSNQIQTRSTNLKFNPLLNFNHILIQIPNPYHAECIFWRATCGTSAIGFHP